MALRLTDKWVWDFWLAVDGPDYHIFYLQAPRKLDDESQRHWHPSIGHAVSQDLQNWEILPDALRPSDQSPSWDDYTTWTGSVIQHQDQWFMFYTGGQRSEEGLIQRIGLAQSPDLLTWTRHPDNPLIELDPRWYETLNEGHWHDQAWRDPWVFQHPETGQFHAFITARAKEGKVDGRGVIGHASSPDLLEWQVHPPVSKPGLFGQLEVPQMVPIQGAYYLLFSTADWTHAQQWIDITGKEPLTGIHYLTADDPLGPYTLPTEEFLLGDSTGSYYTGKLVTSPSGDWLFMAARMYAPDGSFIGEISDPREVYVDQTGKLSLAEIST